MKKKLFTTIGYLLLLAILVGAVTAAIDYHRNHKNDGAKTYGTAKSACDLLTKTTAIHLLSSNVKKTTATPKPITKDVKASQCTYTQTLVSDGKTKYTMSLTMQAPTSKAGVAAVKKAYQDTQKSLHMKDLKVYGDSSFWNYKKGSLDVLGHNVWYSVVYGSTNTQDRNISDTENLADTLSPSF